MKANLLRFSMFVGVAFMAVACGGSDGKGAGTNGAGAGGAGGDTCDPNAEIGCFKGKAEPCKDFNTGFDGDEYCLTPPDPSVGLQIHVGPTDYTDPTQTDKYMIAPGDETNWAEVVVTSNDTSVFTSGYYSHMRPGSHHFILFTLPPDSTTPVGISSNGSGAESAVGVSGGEFTAGATRAVQNAAFDSQYPEDQGVARETLPHSKAAVNLHFINTTDHPLLQEIWVNYITIPEADVKRWVRAITWYGGLGMAVPPGAHQLVSSAGAPCMTPDATAAPNVRIMGITAHFHANTIHEITTMTPAGSSTPVTLFDEYNWHEPAEWIFARSITNSPPDASTKTSGGYNGILTPQVGDSFQWDCEVQNTRDVTLTFGNKVYDAEMCNVFGFYSSDNRNAAPWTCASLAPGTNIN